MPRRLPSQSAGTRSHIPTAHCRQACLSCPQHSLIYRNEYSRQYPVSHAQTQRGMQGDVPPRGEVTAGAGAQVRKGGQNHSIRPFTPLHLSSPSWRTAVCADRPCPRGPVDSRRLLRALQGALAWPRSPATCDRARKMVKGAVSYSCTDQNARVGDAAPVCGGPALKSINRLVHASSGATRLLGPVRPA